MRTARESTKGKCVNWLLMKHCEQLDDALIPGDTVQSLWLHILFWIQFFFLVLLGTKFAHLHFHKSKCIQERVHVKFKIDSNKLFSELRIMGRKTIKKNLFVICAEPKMANDDSTQIG